MNEIINKRFRLMDSKLTELFVSMETKSEYTFFDFGALLLSIKDEMELDEPLKRTTERYRKYVYCLNEIFIKPYSTFIMEVSYNDDTLIKTTTTFLRGNGCDTIISSEETPYKDIPDIEKDKKAQSVNQLYNPTYFETKMRGIKQNNNSDSFKVIANNRTIERLYEEHFSIINQTYDLNELRVYLLRKHEQESKDKPQAKPQVAPAKDWLIFPNQEDRELFILNAKPILQRKKGKELYCYILAMKNNKNFKPINSGEVRTVFKFLQDTFNVDGSRESFNTAHSTYQYQKESFLSDAKIKETQEEIKSWIFM